MVGFDVGPAWRAVRLIENSSWAGDAADDQFVIVQPIEVRRKEPISLYRDEAPGRALRIRLLASADKRVVSATETRRLSACVRIFMSA